MILLFGFAITPKKTLHDLIAHHKDMSGMPAVNDNMNHIQASSFNCHPDNLVVESPFISNGLLLKIQPALPLVLSYTEPIVDFLSVHQLFYGLRGPPSRS